MVISFQPCGIDYELSAYLMDENQKKMNKKNMVQLMVRKLIYAPESFQGPQPMVEGIKQFKKGSGDLRLEATLDKEVGPIFQNVCVYCFHLTIQMSWFERFIWNKNGILLFNFCGFFVWQLANETLDKQNPVFHSDVCFSPIFV